MFDASRPVPPARVQGRSSSFLGSRWCRREPAAEPTSADATGSGKAFKTHGEQINLLCSRGMVIDSDQLARNLLERVNCYWLSGYWYSWREIGADGVRRDVFIPGTTLADIDAVY